MVFPKRRETSLASLSTNKEIAEELSLGIVGEYETLIDGKVNSKERSIIPYEEGDRVERIPDTDTVSVSSERGFQHVAYIFSLFSSIRL